jgi:phosphonate transport system substrate-binding protein
MAIALLTVMAGCGPSDEGTKVDLSETIDESAVVAAPLKAGEYRFGFDLRASPQEDSRQYRPFLDYLEKATGFKFRLQFIRRDESVADQLGSGAVQFAAVGAVNSIKAQTAYGAIPLVRGLNKEGKPSYRAVIVVSPNSAITRVAELRGKRVAFGDINSTQGHIIPRIMLEEADSIGLQDLSGYSYTGSHRNCANAVIANKADACGMQDTMAETLASEKQLRILMVSREFPSSGITASSAVPPAVLDKVRRALLDFDPLGRDAPGLYNWDKTEMARGFYPADPGDYAELQAALRRLNMLPEAELQ